MRKPAGNPAVGKRLVIALEAVIVFLFLLYGVCQKVAVAGQENRVG